MAVNHCEKSRCHPGDDETTTCPGTRCGLHAGARIWPFHLLVRLDQPALAGLSRHGARTWLYTSRGTGFWGPPFRIFAPSEITVLTLRFGTVH